MGRKSWEKDFSHLNAEAQLYLRAYQDQDRRHRSFRIAYKTLALLAALIPPVSLLFTIPASIDDSKKCRKDNDFSPWKAAGFCILFALFPIGSGIMSWHLIKGFEETRREQDKIQKVIFTKDELLERKEYFQQIKAQMRNDFNVDLGTIKPAEKNKKVKLEYEEKGIEEGETKIKVAVYMDAAQKERQNKLLTCGILLFNTLRNEMITEEEAQVKLAKVPGFFRQKHKESADIMAELKAQYKI